MASSHSPFWACEVTACMLLCMTPALKGMPSACRACRELEEAIGELRRTPNVQLPGDHIGLAQRPQG